MRLHLSRLEAVPEPATLVALRELVARMLPRVDLPEVLLEVDAWNGYLSEFTHVAATGSRMEDFATSMAAVLVAEGCNLGFAPVVKPGHPALTFDNVGDGGPGQRRGGGVRSVRPVLLRLAGYVVTIGGCGQRPAGEADPSPVGIGPKPSIGQRLPDAVL